MEKLKWTKEEILDLIHEQTNKHEISWLTNALQPYQPKKKEQESYFLATLEFNTGEQGCIFHKAVKAKDLDEMHERLHEYYKVFYGKENFSRQDGSRWYYNLNGFGDDVCVKFHGADQVTDFSQVVNEIIL